MASSRARAERCGAWARSRGRPCERRASVGGRCLPHSGLNSRWALGDGETPGALIIWAAGAPEYRQKARSVQKGAAIELIRRGAIRTGLFARWPARFMRRVERSGIRVVPELWGPLKQVRFEVAQ